MERRRVVLSILIGGDDMARRCDNISLLKGRHVSTREGWCNDIKTNWSRILGIRDHSADDSRVLVVKDQCLKWDGNSGASEFWPHRGGNSEGEFVHQQLLLNLAVGERQLGYLLIGRE